MLLRLAFLGALLAALWQCGPWLRGFLPYGSYDFDGLGDRDGAVEVKEVVAVVLGDVLGRLSWAASAAYRAASAAVLFFGWRSLDFFARPGTAMVYLGILQAFPVNCIQLILVHIVVMVIGDWLGFVGFAPRRAHAQVKFERFPDKHGDGEVLKRQNIYQSARPLRQGPRRTGCTKGATDGSGLMRRASTG